MNPYVELIRKRRSEKNENILGILSIFSTFDTPMKLDMARLCASQVRDARVLAKWIDILAEENNEPVIAFMIRYLPPITESTRHLADRLIDTLIRRWNLAPRIRESIVCYFEELITARPDLYRWFIRQYAIETDKDVKAALIWPLLEIKNLDKTTTDFLKSILQDVDENLKYNLLLRLLDKDALSLNEISVHLHAKEPISIKLLVLNYFEDRSLCPDRLLMKFYDSELDWEVKNKLLYILLTTSRTLDRHVVEFVLFKLQKETDPSMRHRVLWYFKNSIAINQTNADFFCKLLQHEKAIDNANLMVDWLAPYVSQYSRIKACFLSLLDNAIDLSLAVEIVNRLGNYLPADHALYEQFIEKYENMSNDRIRAVILASLANGPYTDVTLYRLYSKAAASHSRSLRNLGLGGLLLIPMEKEGFPFLEKSVDALLDSSIDPDLRRSFAKKLANIPEKTDACLTRLKEILPQTSDRQIQEVLSDMFSRMKQANDIPQNVDWDWLERRVRIHRSIDHVFPDIFIHFDENKESAKSLLRLMLMDEAFHQSLYRQDISRRFILNFLIVKDQIDLELTQFSLNQLVERKAGESILEGDQIYILALKCSPCLTDIKERLWVLFEREIVLSLGSIPGADLGAVRDVFIRAYGEHGFFQNLVDRLASAPDIKAVKPYLWFLMDTPPWIYNSALIDHLSAHKHQLPWVVEMVRKQSKDPTSDAFLSFCKRYGRQLVSFEQSVALKKEKKGFKDD